MEKPKTSPRLGRKHMLIDQIHKFASTYSPPHIAGRIAANSDGQIETSPYWDAFPTITISLGKLQRILDF